MVTLRIEIMLPDDLLQSCLQHLRNCDMANDPERRGLIHLAIAIQAPDLDAAAIQKIFDSIHPPFENEWVYPPLGKPPSGKP